MTLRTNSANIRGRKWLVLFNCQADGLANSLECMIPGLRVDRTSMIEAKELPEQFSSVIDDYERIIIAPRVRSLVDPSVVNRSNVTWLPHILFQGYHPDLCYLAKSGPLSAGYHSAIVWAAFKAGLDNAATCKLFTSETYAALGYFDSWVPARQLLVESFEAHSIDIRESFVSWSRQGPFMYSINHPRIDVLMGVARGLLRSIGVEPSDTGYIPHDNLANGPAFPVYPEIAKRLGVSGHFYFKAGGGYRVFGLSRFVDASFARYRTAGDVMPDNEVYLPLLSRALHYVESSE